MSAQTRWFVADDRDGSITYSGTWSSIDGSQYNGEGNFGETFLNTLHRTTTTGSSMSFTFTGDAARIMGTTAVKNAKTTPDPDWKCYLDGQETKKESAYQYTENNWVFCKFYDLPAGKHTIRIDITTNGQPFLLDQIQYKPTVSTSNTAAYITRYDPDLAYDSSWQGLGDVGRMATVQGSKVTFSFIGNRLTWFGMYPNQLPHGDAPASYTIDGGAAVAFTIRGGGDTSEYNRQILQTPRLSQDRHTLVVIYQGGTNLTPLVLGNLVVDGGTTELLGTASSSGDSGNGSSGGASSITTVVKDGTTTTTAVGSSITVTKISDADSDILPNADNAENLVNGTLTIQTGTPTFTGGTTVYTLDADSQQVAGNPSDQATNGGTGSKDSKGSGFPVAAIVGIVLGVLLLLLLGGVFLYWKRNRRSHRRYQHRLPEGRPSITVSRDQVTPFEGYLSQGNLPVGAGPVMGMHKSGGTIATFTSAGSLPAGTHTRPSFSSGTPNESLAASSQSNSLQPVRKNRDPFATPSSAPSDSGGERVPGASGSRVVLHEDSGIRMPHGRSMSVVEDIPPQYTPG
ncbi:hypothetical protein D9611_012700 [Ephemerocybe angulata]|uniref:Uncharacterized protein n=1 Tax=Ephemerocybe angulata TaxID=980116 RepID=A0A8H5BA05_9AGAR|nr:hypothetical protein D9611_012700 [Tulosesus angulatus]